MRQTSGKRAMLYTRFPKRGDPLLLARLAALAAIPIFLGRRANHKRFSTSMRTRSMPSLIATIFRALR